jgi:hypothetical protein
MVKKQMMHPYLNYTQKLGKPIKAYQRKWIWTISIHSKLLQSLNPRKPKWLNLSKSKWNGRFERERERENTLRLRNLEQMANRKCWKRFKLRKTEGHMLVGQWWTLKKDMPTQEL